MPFTDQQYIDQLRALVNDEALSKLVKSDNVSHLVQSGKTDFPLGNRNIVDPASVTGAVFQAQADGGAIVNATLLDAVTGVGRVSPAPAKSCAFIYYFQFFTDAQITGYRNNGLRQVGVDPTNASAVASVVQGLFTAACYLGAAEALRINAQAYVKYYNTSTGGKGFDKGQVFKNIKEQADSYETKAQEIRESFYTQQGRSLRPAIGISGSVYRGGARGPTR